MAENTIQCRSVTSKGAVPILVNLLDSKDPDIVEQIVWGIGNISADSVECRDLLIKFNVISKLINVIEKTEKYQTLRQAAWALSNLCKIGKIPPHAEYLKQISYPLFKCIADGKITDMPIVNDIIWAIVILTGEKYDFLPEFHSSKILPKLIELFYQMSDNYEFITPILSIFGNIALAED